jgi:hypothetical protein
VLKVWEKFPPHGFENTPHEKLPSLLKKEKLWIINLVLKKKATFWSDKNRPSDNLDHIVH